MSVNKCRAVNIIKMDASQDKKSPGFEGLDGRPIHHVGWPKSYFGEWILNTRIFRSLVLVTTMIVCSSCGQPEEDTPEDKIGINAQVLEALKPLQAGGSGRPPTGPDGPEPKSATGYINLSLRYYAEEEWEKCIEACIAALNFNPSSSIAYNNICSAYNQLKDFDRAILACNKALALSPDFPRARANLNAAIKGKENL